jgi:hypothetical protein
LILSPEPGIKDKIQRVRDLSDHARQLNELKRKVAEDLDKFILYAQFDIRALASVAFAFDLRLHELSGFF